jgi:formamidopyrimidine-DNA glycosylase
MPELPEVEVTRLSFADRIDGAVVTCVRVGKPLRWPLGIEPLHLTGLRVGAVTRRGKYLWLSLRAGEALPNATGVPPSDGGLLLHLGMSGSLAFSPQPAAR